MTICREIGHRRGEIIILAYLALLSGVHRQEAHQICKSMTYIDLSDKNNYMDEFTSALFLPHRLEDIFDRHHELTVSRLRFIWLL